MFEVPIHSLDCVRSGRLVFCFKISQLILCQVCSEPAFTGFSVSSGVRYRHVLPVTLIRVTWLVTIRFDNNADGFQGEKSSFLPSKLLYLRLCLRITAEIIDPDNFFLPTSDFIEIVPRLALCRPLSRY